MAEPSPSPSGPATPTIRDYYRPGTKGTYGKTAHGNRWKSLTRVCYVQGLSVWADVVTAAKKALPAIDDPAGEDADTSCTLLQTIEVDPLTEDVAKCTLNYEYDESAEKDDQGSQTCTVETGSRIQEVETDLDADDDPILVEYTYATNTPVQDLPNPSQGVNQSQKGLIHRGIPAPFLSITRTEEESPLEKSMEYTGTVNESDWCSGAARTWRCEGITGSLQKNGTYSVRYDFSYRAVTWDERVLFKDKNGNSPDDVAEENGLVIVKVHPEKDFSELNLFEAPAS